VKVHYTVLAERDLDEVAEYTRVMWGEAQRDAYIDMLQHTCESIIPAHRQIAKPVPKRPGLWRWRAEHHYVYFREVKDGIEVVRVLHERQDPPRHL
jgi:toxin ParE1/3/4